MENILEVKNLNKKYPTFALKDVNINLPKGVIMGFIGENGSGKTTTIKTILNIIKDYDGQIKLFGKSNTEEVVKEDNRLILVLDYNRFPLIFSLIYQYYLSQLLELLYLHFLFCLQK